MTLIFPLIYIVLLLFVPGDKALFPLPSLRMLTALIPEVYVIISLATNLRKGNSQ